MLEVCFCLFFFFLPLWLEWMLLTYLPKITPWVNKFICSGFFGHLVIFFFFVILTIATCRIGQDLFGKERQSKKGFRVTSPEVCETRILSSVRWVKFGLNENFPWNLQKKKKEINWRACLELFSRFRLKCAEKKIKRDTTHATTVFVLRSGVIYTFWFNFVRLDYRWRTVCVRRLWFFGALPTTSDASTSKLSSQREKNSSCHRHIQN